MRLNRNIHTDCKPKGDNPKGSLRTVYYNGNSTGSLIMLPYKYCDGCHKMFMMELKEVG